MKTMVGIRADDARPGTGSLRFHGVDPDRSSVYTFVTSRNIYRAVPFSREALFPMKFASPWRLLSLAALVLGAACAGGHGVTPSTMNPERVGALHSQFLPAAACPVAYKGKGVKVVIKDMSGLPQSGLTLFYTSSNPADKNQFQFLNKQGSTTVFAAGNSAAAFPIASCFPGSLAKPGAAFVLPLFKGGRLWISFSPKFVIAGAANGQFTGPSGWSPGAGYNQPWDTVELSDNNPGVFVNLTRVDMLGLPLQLEVLPIAKSSPFKQVGEVIADYPKILQALVNDAPFNKLVTTVPGFSPVVPRVLNPSHVSSFPNVYNAPAYFAGGYMKKVTAYYQKPPKPIVYNTQYKGAYCLGNWNANSNGTNFIFKQGGVTNTYPASLFTTAYIFADDPSPKYVAGTCAYLLDKILLQELNRGVALTPKHPMDDPKTYYPAGTINNQYACILHKYSLHNATYAFAYDDAANQASAFSNPAPTQVNITIGPIPKTIPKPTKKAICTT